MKKLQNISLSFQAEPSLYISFLLHFEENHDLRKYLITLHKLKNHI